MTCSRNDTDVEAVLDRVVELLDERRLQALIDERIDSAVSTFRVEGNGNGPIKQNRFLEIISGFVSHIYAHGLSLPRSLNAAQARAEAIAILEEFYEGKKGHRYDRALLDAMVSGVDGIQVVLSRMVAALKARQRRGHVQWILAKHVELLGWKAKCDLVEIVSLRLRNLLQEEVGYCCADQVAHACSQIVAGYVDAVNEFRQVASRHSPI